MRLSQHEKEHIALGLDEKIKKIARQLRTSGAGGANISERTIQISGTSNQVTVTPDTPVSLGQNRSFTISLPQNIDTSATPTFAGLKLSGLSQGVDITIDQNANLIARPPKLTPITQGYEFDGIDDYLTIADSAALAIGLSDFTISGQFSLIDWTPGTTKCLANKAASNLGFKVNVTTAGLLQLQIGNGTNFTTFQYNSTTAIPATDTNEVFWAISVDRDGLITFSVNGIQLGSTVDVSGSAAQTVTSSGALELMRDGSNYTSGRVYRFYIDNIALSVSELADRWRRGIANKYKYGSFAPFYSSNFSAGADSWGATRATVTGNIDGISDGTTSKDDVLRVYADGSTNSHETRRTFLTQGRAYRFTGSYYIRNTGGTTYLDGIRLYRSAGTVAADLLTTLETVGTWSTFDVENRDTAVVNNAFATQLSITARKGGSNSFTGANSVTDDLFYLKDIVVYQLGAVVALEPDLPAVQSSVWYDSSPSSLNATVAGSANRLNTIKSTPNRIDYYGSTGNAAQDIYESGTWTPTLGFSTNGDLNVVYSTRVGHYRRIGDLVTASFSIVTSTFTHSTAAGSILLSGLPYAIGASGTYGLFANIIRNCTVTHTGVDLLLLLGAGTTEINISQRAADGTITNLSVTEFTSGVNRTISGSFTYRV